MVGPERAAFTGCVLVQIDRVRKETEYEINCYTAADIDEQCHVTYPGWWCDSLSWLEVFGAAASPGLDATSAQALCHEGCGFRDVFAGRAVSFGHRLILDLLPAACLGRLIDFGLQKSRPQEFGASCVCAQCVELRALFFRPAMCGEVVGHVGWGHEGGRGGLLSQSTIAPTAAERGESKFGVTRTLLRGGRR